MNSIFGLTCAAILCCVTCEGQTNAPTSAPIRFFLAPTKLANQTSSPSEKVEEARPAKAVVVAATAHLELAQALPSGSLNDAILGGAKFSLILPDTLPKSKTERLVDEIFTPQQFKLKRFTVSSPIATAIMRKNPLSLLSGFRANSEDGQIDFRLLNISW